MRQLKITAKITSRDTASMEKYLKDINAFPLLTLEEEVELAERIQSGDHLALNKLVQGNLRFVVSVAKQYQFQHVKLNDLINEGNLGLIEAAKRFDHTKGFKFISYAVWWIRQGITSYLQNNKIVRIPSNQVSNLNKADREELKFLQENERMPTPEELEELTDIKMSMLNSTSNVRNVLSFDQENDEGNKLYDVTPSAATARPFEKEDNKIIIDQLLQHLSEQEAHILTHSFGLGGNEARTLEDISNDIGVSRERIRQLKVKALGKLKSKKFRHLAY